jgi:hypothetical protein
MILICILTPAEYKNITRRLYKGILEYAKQGDKCLRFAPYLIPA